MTGRFTLEQLEAKRLLASDLSISLAEVPADIRATDELSYVVRVRNDGPDEAVGALVEIPNTDLEGASWTRQGPHAFPPEVDLTQRSEVTAHLARELMGRPMFSLVTVATIHLISKYRISTATTAFWHAEPEHRNA
jgi:hypothetical protein